MDRDCLENSRTMSTVGSNPTLSATEKCMTTRKSDAAGRQTSRRILQLTANLIAIFRSGAEGLINPRYASPMSWIERIAQAVAHQIEGQHRQEDGHPGEDGQPPGAIEQLALAVLQHVAP